MQIGKNGVQFSHKSYRNILLPNCKSNKPE